MKRVNRLLSAYYFKEKRVTSKTAGHELAVKKAMLLKRKPPSSSSLPKNVLWKMKKTIQNYS